MPEMLTEREMLLILTLCRLLDKPAEPAQVQAYFQWARAVLAGRDQG